MASRGRAKIAIGRGLAVWLLEAKDGFGEADFHSHHAIQLTVCLDGVLTLTGDATRLSGDVLAVAPDARHKLDAAGLLAIVFIEPESAAGRTLLATLFSTEPLAVVSNPEFLKELQTLRHALEPAFAQERMIEVCGQAVDRLVPPAIAPAADARIARVIAYANDHLDVSLAEAATAAGVYLSGDRLRHLFVEHTGLPFKTYMLWLRLVRAVQLYSLGQSLTHAAHSAGFADSAHFSRAFKRTFGAPATTLRRL